MKPWWKSKTVWFNILVAMGAAAEASLNVIENYFDPRIFYVLLIIVPAVNVVLRFISSTSITKS